MTRVVGPASIVDRAKLAGHIPLDLSERAQRRRRPRRPAKFGSSIDTSVRHSSALLDRSRKVRRSSRYSLFCCTPSTITGTNRGSFRKPIGCSDGLGPARNGAGHHCSKGLRFISRASVSVWGAIDLANLPRFATKIRVPFRLRRSDGRALHTFLSPASIRIRAVVNDETPLFVRTCKDGIANWCSPAYSWTPLHMNQPVVCV